MELTRRHLAAAGALALGISNLLRSAPSFAESAEDASVGQAVEVLRKALLTADKGEFENLAADQLSYGHSSGKVQTKAEFIDGVITRKAIIKSLTFPELNIAVFGDAAVVRHLYVSDSETDGKPNSVRIGALQVWQKQGGNWKLLARQGFTLPECRTLPLHVHASSIVMPPGCDPGVDTWAFSPRTSSVGIHALSRHRPVTRTPVKAGEQAEFLIPL
jgi:hypothetical protein